MDKKAIKTFALWARERLIRDAVGNAGLLGITEKEIKNPLPESIPGIQLFDIGTAQPARVMGDDIEKRHRLVTAIQQKAEILGQEEAFRSVMEEAAYTWFNRLIALRFMEVNDYIPGHLRVLSSDMKNKTEPDLVTHPFDSDLSFTDKEKEEILTMQDENKTDELFRILFWKQCDALHALLPHLFEKTDDTMALLLRLSVTDPDGVVQRLVRDIPEDDFNVAKGGQVEIIGWLYQYYNTVPKEEVFKALKKNVKISAENIPAATQLFTPDWIVRYMVENSVGRLWKDGHPDTSCRADWTYYIDEAKQDPEVEEKLKEIHSKAKNLTPETITVIDPCMGSGHILVRAFEVLMGIYEEQGWSPREAAQSIITNNLYGLDIDCRAYQLAYFAVMMKARQYDRRALTRGLTPHLYDIPDSASIDKSVLDLPGDALPAGKEKEGREEIQKLLTLFVNGKNYGSLIEAPKLDWDLIRAYASPKTTGNAILTEYRIDQSRVLLQQMVEVGQILSDQYDAVITNPPYMGIRQVNAQLSIFMKNKYPHSKSDVFSCFIERCQSMAKSNRYMSMITQHAWMFLTSYTQLRENLGDVDSINMIHLGPRAFDEIGGEVVQSTSFVIRKNHLERYKGVYCRLISANSEIEKKNLFLSMKNRYVAMQDKFFDIPGRPIAYWVSESVFGIFKNKTLGEYAKPRQGLATSDNGRFLRLWHEVNSKKIKFNAYDKDEAKVSKLKWFPYNKGGGFRKWYGNNEYLINWENDGAEVKSLAFKLYKSVTRTIKNIQFYFREGVTWSTLASGSFNARYFDNGYLFDTKGSSCFFKNENERLYCLALMNSNTANELLCILAPTLDYNAGSIARLPIIWDKNREPEINSIVESSIRRSKQDWDMFETSWDFGGDHLLLSIHAPDLDGGHLDPLSVGYEILKKCVNRQFKELKKNEEELNRIFIDIYGLADELTPEESDKDVTIHYIVDQKTDASEEMQKSPYLLTKENVVKNLISYGVGCLFGRYSLDTVGLVEEPPASESASGFSEKVRVGTAEQYSEILNMANGRTNAVDALLITDTEYFTDDIVGRFVDWLSEAAGADHLEENLIFIADALGVKGRSPRDVLRQYFLKDFYKDHVKKYQKRPIYWLFSSGKQQGFSALVYMHRWDADTMGRVRTEYLHPLEAKYEAEADRQRAISETAKTEREKQQALKISTKIEKQLLECRSYDERLGHLATEHPTIDLDDGVKVNYEKVQTGRDGKVYPVLAKI